MKRLLTILGIALLLAPPAFIVFLFYRFTLGGLFDYIFQTIFWLAFGWIYELPELSTKAQENVIPIIVVSTSMLSALILLHLTINRFIKMQSWRWRHSIAITGIVFAFILTVTACFVIIDEGYRVVHSEASLTETWSMGRRIDPKAGIPIDEDERQVPTDNPE